MDKQGEVSPQNNLQTAKNDQKQDLAGTSTATANTEEEKKSEVASCSEETKDDIILTALKETEGNLSSKELSDEEMHLNYSDEVMNEVDKELNNKVLEPSNPSKTESTSDVTMETLVEKGDNKKAHTEIQNLSSFLEQELVDTLDDLDTLNITKEEEEKLLLESPLELKECEKIIEITNTECPIIGNVVALPAVSTIQSSDELSRVPKPISIEKDKDMLEESQVQNTDNIFQIETTMINPENSQIGSVMAANKAVTASPEESASFPVSSSEASMEHDVIAISSVKDNETPNVKIFLESKDVSNKTHDTPTIPESHQPNATEVFTASSAENDTDNTLFDEVKHTSLEDTNQEISSNDKVITDCPSTFANKDGGQIEYSAKTASLPPILIKGNIDSVVSEKQNIDQAPSNTFLITADTKNTEPTSSSVNEGIIELNNTETYDFTSNESIIEPMSIEVLNTVPVPLTSNEGMLEAISEEANETEPALLKSNKITLNTMSIEVKNTESVPSTSNKGTKETLLVKAQNTEPVSSTFNEEILQVITVESNKTEVASSTSNEGSIEPISLEVNNTQCVYLTSNESIIEPMLVEVDNTKTVPITSNVAMSDPISEESNKNELASSTSNEESIEPILVDITKSATQISNESMTEPMLVEGDNTETDHSTSKVTIFNPILEETNKTELASLSSNEGSGEAISVELNNTEQKVMPNGTKTTKTFPTTSNEGIDSLSVKTNIAESVPSTLNEGNNASDLKEATEPAPLTSKEENIGLFILEGTVEAVPSVSAEDTKVQDVTDDAQEITDSLSLLAESSERSMEDEQVPSTSKKDNVGQLALEETVEAVPLTSAENMTAPDVVDEAQEITALLAEPSQSIMEDEAVVKTNISECDPSTLNEGNNASDLQDATVPVPSTSNKNNIGHTVLEGTVEAVPSTSAEDTTALDNINKGLKISDSLGLLAEPSEKSMEDEPVPSTSKQENIGLLVLEGTVEAVPSTSADDSPALDVMDEAFEITDSLGLLAESSGRSMEEDEDPEPEDEEDIENEEDDDDYDPEDESAQPSPDMSDDSNTQNSEVNTNYVAKQISDEIELQSDNVFDSLINVDSEDKDMKLKYDLESEGDVSEAADKESDANKSTPIKPASTTIGEDKTSANVNDDNDVKVIPEGKDKKEPEKKDESILLGLLISSDEEKSDSTDNIAKKDGKTKKRKKCEDDAGHIRHVMDVVHIEENSSSEDDIQIVKKDESSTKSVVVTAPDSSVQGTDKEQASKKSDMPKETPAKAKSGLEVFSLDSDEEEKVVVPSSAKPSSLKPSVATSNATQPSPPGRCINPLCRSDVRTARFVPANASAVNFFDAKKRKRPTVCENCSESLMERTLGLLEGVSSMRPLFELKMERVCADLVEISDSDTDSPDDEADEKAAEKVGVDGQRVLEEQLVDLLNSSWRRLKLDERMSVAKSEINDYLEVLEKECLEVDTMLSECQVATDELRRQLYATFASETRTLPAVQIYDTPYAHYSTREADVDVNTQIRRSKRVRSIQMDDDSASKRLAVQTNKADQMLTVETESVGNKTDLDDDNTDLCVVNHSSESPPEGLPAVGTLTKTPVTANMKVYAMRNSFGTWVPATVLDTQPRQATSSNNQYTVCRVKFDHKKDPKNAVKQLSARHLAYQEPCDVRMTIGTRIIALFKDVSNASKQGSFFSGVVAENPSPVNNYRYLVFFDDGYAQYVSHPDTRVVCECSPLVWEEVHPHSREFVHAYLNAYPERPMVRLHTGQKFKTERNGKFCDSVVTGVDASLVRVQFGSDGREEWIYRGSTRLEPLFTEVQAAGRHRQGSARQRSKATRMPNMPYVEYTRSDDLETNKQVAQQQIEELKRQRSVAKKSTAWSQLPPPRAPQRNVDSHMSRVVYYTPKAPLTPHKMVPHTCGPQCRRSDVVPLHDLRNYNPLARPLLSGWERQIVRFKLRKEVMYRAPCGRRLRDMAEIHKYLQTIGSEMGVDLFDINPNTHCLAEFILNRCIVSKKDLSHGKENVPVPCVNYYDNALPEFCSYNTVRTPTAGVPLNLDPDFLCGCDCTDDCQDKSKCACWKMTLDGARTIGMNGDLGYVYKRLLDPVPSGIYECNSRCKCKATCLNRVAQHPLQLKLQVFKTVDRGWGIRALNDVPKGGFLCIYAGNLLTDATANLDGLNEGDEYLAELDYIEVVEQMKEGYEEDVPKKDKELDRRNSKQSEEESSSEQSEEETSNRDENEDDDDFKPAYDVPGGMQFNKRLRKREKRKKDKEEAEVVVKEKVQKVAEDDDDCITISDDEEVREPSTFTAQAGMEDKSFVSKHSSVRALYGKDEACYIMDAKVQGNIGRYLNHSCQPNVFVQNVFVDTHDPRFPWVAFFALSHIKAGTELTWNYNYDVGSVPGKVLHCYCGAPNCRKRLL